MWRRKNQVGESLPLEHSRLEVRHAVGLRLGENFLARGLGATLYYDVLVHSLMVGFEVLLEEEVTRVTSGDASLE